MEISCRVQFDFATITHSSIFYESYMPEFQQTEMKRSNIEIVEYSPDSARIVFNINATDATAFRATMNSLIQFVHIVEKTIDLTD